MKFLKHWLKGQYQWFIPWVAVIASITLLVTGVSAQLDDPQGPLGKGLVSEAPNGDLLPGQQVFTAGPITFKRVVTYRLPQTTTSTDFRDLVPASTVVPIQPGHTALINARFHAETRCNGGGNLNWCEVQILIGRVEGHPQASSFPPDTFALDSTDGSTEGIGSWEGHALERHRCIENPSQTTTLNVPVVVQWKVTDFDGSGGPEFWIDDWSLAVERADHCSPVEKEQ